jgi:HAD superfamily hydrolase (TIGR01509 family)
VPAKAIIFDIGRVIIRVNLSRLLEPLAALAPARSNSEASERPTPQQIWRAIESDPRWTDWQEGRMTLRQWHEYVTGRLRVNVGFAEFCQAWNCTLDPQPILEDSLFETLGKVHKLALLSNTDPLHSDHIETHFSFVRHFPVRIYSWRVGASKPSPEIYLAALEALNIHPSEAVYIDDIGEYTAAARRLGLATIEFENAGQLLQQLSSRGLFGSEAVPTRFIR